MTESSNFVMHLNDVRIREDERQLIDETSLEEALTLTGKGKYTYISFAICTLTFTAVCIEMFGLGIVITTSRCDLDLDTYRQGIIGSLPSIAIIISAMFWGYLADTKGRKFTLVVTCIGTFIASALSSFATNWIFMAVMKFFSALFGGGTCSIVYASLGESTPQLLRARYLQYCAILSLFAQGLSALIAFPVLLLDFSVYMPILGIYYKPWRLMILIFALIIGVCTIFLILFVLESPKFLLSQGKHDESLNILRKIFSMNTKKDVKYFKVNRLESERSFEPKTQGIFSSLQHQMLPLFQRAYIKNTILVSLICIITYGTGLSFGVWIPVIFDSYGLNIEMSSYYTFCELLDMGADAKIEMGGCIDKVNDFALIGLLAFSIYSVILGICTVQLTKLVDKKWVFIGIHLLCALSSFILNHVYSAASSFIFLVLMSNGILMGITTTYAVDLFPTTLRAMAVSFTMMMGRIVSFFFINFIGSEIDNNCHNFFYIYGGIVLLGAVFGLFLPKDKK